MAIWLAATAKRYGYPADLLNPVATEGQPSSFNATGRLKGKARKEAKASQKVNEAKGDKVATIPTGPIYTIGVQDFIALAEFIADRKPAVVVPSDFVRAANRAIRLRHRSHGWYKKQSKEDQASDNTHGYFIGVLEKTRELLRPYMAQAVDHAEHPESQRSDLSTEEEVNEDETRPKPVGSTGVGEGTVEDQGVKDDSTSGQVEGDAFVQDFNIFDHLEVNEPSEAFLNAPNIVADPRPENSKDTYKVKQPEDDLMERYLALHCLFTDIRGIRRRIQNIWTNYKQGHLDLASASITSNAAIEFVRDLNEAFAQQFPSNSSCERMQRLFFGTQVLTKASIHSGPARLSHSPSRRTIWRKMYACLLSLL